jgi:hypothetical protein
MDHVRAAIQHIAPVDSVEALEKASVSVRTATGPRCLAGGSSHSGPERCRLSDQRHRLGAGRAPR